VQQPLPALAVYEHWPLIQVAVVQPLALQSLLLAQPVAAPLTW
jgi:hypothetical protein